MTVDGAEAARLPPVFERALVLRLIAGVLFLLLVVGGLGWSFREPISALAEVFVRSFGALGVFFGMLVVDAYAFPPLAHEPILFFAYAGGMSFVEVTLAAGLGSFLAGPLGYLVGRGLARVGFVRNALTRTGLAVLMRKHGVWVVALAAVSPLPFSASTYAAGAIGIPPGPFLAVCLLRFPKVAAYLGMIALGWSLG